MATKLGRMMTSFNGLLPVMSHDLLIMWPCEMRGSLTGEDLARKCLSCHRLFVFSSLSPSRQCFWTDRQNFFINIL